MTYLLPILGLNVLANSSNPLANDAAQMLNSERLDPAIEEAVWAEVYRIEVDANGTSTVPYPNWPMTPR